MLPGGDYKETAQQAVELVKKGFNPVPHCPARSILDENELDFFLSGLAKEKINKILEQIKSVVWPNIFRDMVEVIQIVIKQCQL